MIDGARLGRRRCPRLGAGNGTAANQGGQLRNRTALQYCLNTWVGQFSDALFDGFTVGFVTVTVGSYVVAQLWSAETTFGFTGFFQPVDNQLNWNGLKAGGGRQRTGEVQPQQ
jgi:hypothetical protein